MNASATSSFQTFNGIAGLLLLTCVVVVASFVIGLGYGVAVLGRRLAVEEFLNVPFIAKLLGASFFVSAVFWMRSWQKRRSRGIR